MYYKAIETAKLNDVNLYIYLEFLFEEMPKQAQFFAARKALWEVMPKSKKHRQYEKDDLAQTVNRCLPPDDEKPVSPKKIEKKRRKSTAGR